VKEKSFEEALEKIGKLIEELEEGNLPLKESVGKFKDGKELLDFCNKELKEAEMSVQKIVDDGGKIRLEEFEQTDNTIKPGENYKEYTKEITEDYPNAYRSWKKDEEELLLKLFDEGRSVDEISEMLRRQPGGIKSRLVRLGKVEGY